MWLSTHPCSLAGYGFQSPYAGNPFTRSVAVVFRAAPVPCLAVVSGGNSDRDFCARSDGRVTLPTVRPWCTAQHTDVQESLNPKP